MTKERPILFSAPMVRAILEGRKTQTRRVAGNVPGTDGFVKQLDICPHGSMGDRLWVRETTRSYFLPNLLTGEPTSAICGQYVADDEAVVEERGFDLAWWYSRPVCPAIHMPRFASRITLEITDVRVQRLQEISERDAIAEGMDAPINDGLPEWTATQMFKPLWDSINAKRGFGWDVNPWVWALTFQRIV